MVALFLVAMMAGGVMSALGRGKTSHNLRAAAGVLGDALAGAHSSAATEGRKYRWAWDGEARRWGLYRESDPAVEPGVFKPASAGGRQSEALPEGVIFGGIHFALTQPPGQETEEPESPPQITFYPDGHSETVYVMLRTAAPEEAASEALTVAVNGITGRVRVLPGDAYAKSLEEAAAAEANK